MRTSELQRKIDRFVFNYMPPPKDLNSVAHRRFTDDLLELITAVRNNERVVIKEERENE